MSELVDAILAAPAGVALLGRLEARQFVAPSEQAISRSSASGIAVVYATTGAEDIGTRPVPWEVPTGSAAQSVAAAVAEAQSMSIAELLSVAVESGNGSAGPWSGSANVELIRAYRDAPGRVAIAKVVAERFDAIDTSNSTDRQQWWHTNHSAEGWFATRRLEKLDAHVYGNGEFTHGGVWTVTDPPAETHRSLASAWELDDPPISRWRMPIRSDARIFQIDRPGDWVDLVKRYPTVPTRDNGAWELPGMNDHIRDPLLAPISNGHAARNAINHLIVPEWSRVAGDFDGVHLTWRGWLTTEGFVSDTPDGGVTMLRYWFSERTLWLNDVFGEPEPLHGPTFDHDGSVDVTTDEPRRLRDREVLRAMLGH